MVVNPMQEVDDSEEELLGTPEPTPHSQRILAISVTKKVSSVPDAVLSPGAQQGYQFPDTELIVLKGTLNDKPVKILFDTGSTHNVISSKLVKKLKLPTRASNYSYTVELADGKGTEVWDRQVADLPFKIQSYEDRMDFEITRLARFDMVLGKQWHAWKKPTIDFSSHVIQFEHEGRRLLIRGEPDLSEAKLLRATKMLKLELPDTIGISKKCPSATEFLAKIHRNMQVAREKLQQAADRAKFYADKKRSARTFDEGDRVFLQVPLSSTSLSTGKCPKLSPRFCGPWTIIKKLSDVAYRLELPPGCRVHPVFHVSKLKRFISKDDNLIDGMISLQEQETTDHGPDKILDRREKRLRNRTLHDYLVAWKGLPLTDATWESEALIRKHFPLLIIEDADLRRGREC
ncbi:hypothetical protein L7F22_051380 [Adiantum nelumboides]|nr:hypothetical protein [Adiantum nelumboides]